MTLIKSIYLASKSPRRRMQLSQICDFLKLDLSILETNQNHCENLERQQKNEQADAYVKRVARQKADLGRMTVKDLKLNPGLILAGDTIVKFKNCILQKPKDHLAAHQMIKNLSNNSHSVITSIVLFNPYLKKKSLAKQFTQLTISSTVEFANIPDSWIKKYVAADNPLDKCGGYSIQSDIIMFVKRIECIYSSILGLPMAETINLLEKVIN